VVAVHSRRPRQGAHTPDTGRAGAPPAPPAAARDGSARRGRWRQKKEAGQPHSRSGQEQKRRQKLRGKKRPRSARWSKAPGTGKEEQGGRRSAQARQAKEKQLAQEARNKEEAARAEKDLKAQRDANLRRIAGMAGATGNETATGTAQRSAGPSASYAGKVAAKVKPNIVFPDEIAGNPMADVEVRAAPDGTIQREVSSPGMAWTKRCSRPSQDRETAAGHRRRVPSTLIIGFRPRIELAGLLLFQ
jgi:colicin import membrane protein